MEPNGLPGGILSGMPSGMLGLKMPIHQQSQHQHQQHHHQMVTFSTQDSHPHTQSQQSDTQLGYPYTTKAKHQQLALSNEDEPGFTGEENGGGDVRKPTSSSPWQRMKWTDSMIRLLIMVVFYIGDEFGSDGNDPSCTGKKKSGGILQKKGKWKSVSRAMMEKGFYVSPQQCEDKFNDLNKRYKRVNDILGKGIACRVVENQSLLDSMDQLSPKMKEEVHKLLNSKHLFFREMCAYHNTGGGVGGSGGASAHQSLEVAMESSHNQQQQRCLHLTETANVIANSRSRAEIEGSRMAMSGSRDEEDEVGEDDADEDEDGDDEDEEEDEIEKGCGRGHSKHLGGHEDDDDDDDGKLLRKRQRRGMWSSSSMLSPSMQQLSCELTSVLQDATKSPWEQRQWMRSQSMKLKEERVGFQCQAFELEKQRLKWVKFSGKKEREMERMKLDNERMRLENKRMVLLLRQKELEMLDLHQQPHLSSKRPELSPITG